MGHDGGLRFIEFFGLPGCGKTTVAGALEHALRARGYQVVSRRHALSDTGRAPLRHVKRARFVVVGLALAPGRFVRAARLIRAGRQASALRGAKVTWNLWCVMGWYLWERNRPARRRIAVVDQGLAQALWSIETSTGERTGAWRALLSDFGLDDVAFVHVRCEPALSRCRAQRRDAARRHLAGVRADEVGQRGTEIVERIDENLQVLVGDGRSHRCSNDAHADPRFVAGQLLGALLDRPLVEDVADPTSAWP